MMLFHFTLDNLELLFARKRAEEVIQEVDQH